MFTITTHTDRYKRISESGLALCKTPTADQIGASPVWAALPHRKLWAELINSLARNGFPLLDSPELFVNPTGLDVVGGLKVQGSRQYTVPLPNGRECVGQAANYVVIGNNNGGKGSLRLAAGASVWICDNGMICGDTRITRKHTIGLDWRQTIESFCRDLQDSFQAQGEKIQRMIDSPMDDEQAAHWLIERRRKARIPCSTLDAAWDFWRKPPHEEFSARNRWSMYNALTEAAKTGSVRSQVRALELA